MARCKPVLTETIPQAAFAIRKHASVFSDPPCRQLLSCVEGILHAFHSTAFAAKFWLPLDPGAPLEIGGKRMRGNMTSGTSRFDTVRLLQAVVNDFQLRLYFRRRICSLHNSAAFIASITTPFAKAGLCEGCTTDAGICLHGTSCAIRIQLFRRGCPARRTGMRLQRKRNGRHG